MVVERASGITTVRPTDPVYRVVLWVQQHTLDLDYASGHEADEYQITEKGEHTAARLASTDPTSGEPMTFAAYRE